MGIRRLGEEAGLATDAALDNAQRVIRHQNAWAAGHANMLKRLITLTPVGSTPFGLVRTRALTE